VGDPIDTMFPMRRPFFLLVAALAMLASAAVPAAASIAEALSLEGLVHTSDHVVVATAVATESRWDGPDRIVTDVTLAVSERMKGRSRAGDSLVVTFVGGAVDGIGMRVEGAPRFAMGRPHLVFAGNHRETGYVVPTGLSQGVMPIEESEGRRFVHPGGAGLALVTRSASGALLRAAPAVMHRRALDDVLAEIRDHVASEGTR
jgi:hypothetical protein